MHMLYLLVLSPILLGLSAVCVCDDDDDGLTVWLSDCLSVCL